MIWIICLLFILLSVLNVGLGFSVINGMVIMVSNMLNIMIGISVIIKVNICLFMLYILDGFGWVGLVVSVIVDCIFCFCGEYW